MLQKVQPDALARENGDGVARDGRDDVAAFHLVAVLFQRNVLHVGADRVENAPHDVDAADDPVVLHDVFAGNNGVRADRRGGRDVPRADILAERGADQFFDIFRHEYFFHRWISFSFFRGRRERFLCNPPMPAVYHDRLYTIILRIATPILNKTRRDVHSFFGQVIEICAFLLYNRYADKR